MGRWDSEWEGGIQSGEGGFRSGKVGFRECGKVDLEWEGGIQREGGIQSGKVGCLPAYFAERSRALLPVSYTSHRDISKLL